MLAASPQPVMLMGYGDEDFPRRDAPRRARPHPVRLPSRRRKERRPPRRSRHAAPTGRSSRRSRVTPSGIGLVVFAGLAVLSVWFDAAGPMGQAISGLLQAAFGLLAVVFPVIGVFWGFVLLRDVAPEDRVRMFIGFGLLTLGVLGMLSIARGNPGRVRAARRHQASRPAWADAGGIIGAIGADPLSKVVSPYGAFVIDCGPGGDRPADLHRHVVRRAEQKVPDFRASLVREGRGREDAPRRRRPPRRPRRLRARRAGARRCGRQAQGAQEARDVPGGHGPGRRARRRAARVRTGRAARRAPAGDEPGLRRRHGARSRARSSPPRARTSFPRSTCCARRRPRPTTASHETGHHGGARAHAHRRSASTLSVVGLPPRSDRHDVRGGRSPPAPR